MKPLSLRFRLTLTYSLVLAAVLAASGFLSYQFLATRLERTLNEELTDRAAALHGYLRYRDGALTLAYDRNDDNEAYFIHNATRYYQAFDLSSGVLQVQSRDLDLLGIEPTPDEVQALSRQPGVQDVAIPQGSIRFHNSIFTSGNHRFLVRVGITSQPVTTALREFAQALLLLIPAGVILASLGGWQMARRALQPTRKLAEAARRIDIERLSDRLPVQGSRDELDQLAEAFNHTLARLEGAVGQMKQFTASVSHELRTPLTAMRGEAEVALLEAKSTDEYRRVLGSQLEELDQLTHMINQLMVLARAEAGEIRLGTGPVNLTQLVESLVEQMEPVAASRQLSLRSQCRDAVAVSGDANWLERVVLNLLDNAIKFTPPGGQVEIAVLPDTTYGVLTVQDTGPGIPAEALPHIFERFYRAEPSRSKQVEGVGLGLALVKWIVEQHGGLIDVKSAPGEGTRFDVRLPLVGPLPVPAKA